MRRNLLIVLLLTGCGESLADRLTESLKRYKDIVNPVKTETCTSSDICPYPPVKP